MASLKWSDKGDASLALTDKLMALTDPSGTPGNGTETIGNILGLDKSRMVVSVVTADADVTGAVGVIHVVDMNDATTPFTASHTYRLPSTAAVGDRAGVAISTGDHTHALGVQTTAASDDTINGTDHDSSDWATLSATGQYRIFQCIVANTAWLEIDREVAGIPITVIKTSGNYTIDDNLLGAEFAPVGGGGGSAGSATTSASQISFGTAGGGGGWPVRYFTRPELVAMATAGVITISYGAAGAAGAGGGNGGTGGSTVVGTGGNTLTGLGGAGGISPSAAGATQGAGGQGGAATGPADAAIHYGGNGEGTSGGFGSGLHGGNGGGSLLGQGAVGRTIGQAAAAGAGYGAGAAGPTNNQSSAGQVGAAGTAGAVRIVEYRVNGS